jgi:hypothetical protein
VIGPRVSVVGPGVSVVGPGVSVAGLSVSVVTRHENDSVAFHLSSLSSYDGSFVQILFPARYDIFRARERQLSHDISNLTTITLQAG